MKRLDQYIETQRENLDLFEPDNGHLIRFRNKLQGSRNLTQYWLMRVAAVFFITAFISLNLYLFRSTRSDYLPDELKETAWFYNSRAEIILSEIQDNQIMDNSEKQVILKDINDFDKEYKNILKDLSNFPGDERLINAFIDYHRSRTEFLEGILNQINSTNLIII